MADDESIEPADLEHNDAVADDNDGGSYWNFSGWMNYAKEKSKKTVELMKKDFAELRTTVRSDAVTALSRTVDTVKQKVTRSNIEDAREVIRSNVTKIFDDVAKKVAVVPPDDSETTACIITEDGELKSLNDHEFRIYEMTLNYETFVTKPESSAEFEAWNNTFSLDTYQQEMIDLQRLYASIRKHHTELVPSSVSHDDFWRNFLYRVEMTRSNGNTGVQHKQASALPSTNDCNSEKRTQAAVEVSAEVYPTESIGQSSETPYARSTILGSNLQQTATTNPNANQSRPDIEMKESLVNERVNDSPDSGDEWVKYDA